MTDDIRARLLALFEQSGMSQDDLAESAKVQQRTISRYFSGKMQPKLQTLQKIAGVFGYHIEVKLVRGKPVQ